MNTMECESPKTEYKNIRSIQFKLVISTWITVGVDDSVTV